MYLSTTLTGTLPTRLVLRAAKSMDYAPRPMWSTDSAIWTSSSHVAVGGTSLWHGWRRTRSPFPTWDFISLRAIPETNSRGRAAVTEPILPSTRVVWRVMLTRTDSQELSEPKDDDNKGSRISKPKLTMYKIKFKWLIDTFRRLTKESFLEVYLKTISISWSDG